MRTATAETVRALRRAIGDGTQRAWAIANDVPPVDVSDCLRGKGMKAVRENRIRAALGLPPLRWQTIELMEGQRVVTVAKPRRHVRRASTMTPEQAALADELARERGYRSFGAMAVAELLANGDVDELYTGQERRNGG